MNKIQLTGAALAVGAAALFAFAPVFAAETATAPMVQKSKDATACACKGKCKGGMSKHDCKKADAKKAGASKIAE